jgi:drug/metabolite transporter (DMT)-like permease
LFALLGGIWGCSFLLMKIANRSFAPVEVSFGRILLGALTVTGLAFATGRRLPRGWATWRRLAVTGFLLNAVPYTMFSYATTRVPSVTVGFWHGASPLFTALSVAATSCRFELQPRRVVGLLIGFGGVVTILLPGLETGGSDPVGVAACTLGAVVYGVGYAYVRSQVTVRADSALALTAGQMICGTVEVGLFLPLTVHAAPQPRLTTAACVVVLGVVGTGLASAMNLELIRRVGAATGSTVIFLVTACSAVVGVTFGAESTTWHHVAGSAVVVVGIVLSGRTVKVPAQAPARWALPRPRPSPPAPSGLAVPPVEDSPHRPH